ncbi:MAG: phosphohydrolase [Marmoricola sp.]|nr:phosphohydrolase [Marmoricola sp.]
MHEDPDAITRARNFARWVHRGQVDKAGNDYFTAHIEDVVRRLEGEHEAVRVVGYLHDVVEDGPTSTLTFLAWSFEPEIVDAVAAITHRPNEPRAEYYRRVRANPIALKVKVQGDIPSNTDLTRLAQLPPGIRGRLTEKYRSALEELSK